MYLTSQELKQLIINEIEKVDDPSELCGIAIEILNERVDYKPDQLTNQ